MKFMHTIVCGLTIMLLFPLAGMICSEPASDKTQTNSSSVTFYPTGKEPPPLKQINAKPEKLFQSPNMKGVAIVEYAIQVTLDNDNLNDGSSSKSSGDQGSSWSLGEIIYRPRISIRSKINPLPKSCLLVIEYFSKESSSKSMNRRECVEHISLPAIGKGESLTMDANGVKFSSWKCISGGSSHSNYKPIGDIELYGVIVSLFKDDKLQIQMCTPYSLTKECTATIPAPQAYTRFERALGVSAMAKSALSDKPVTNKPPDLEIVVQKAKKQKMSGTDYDDKEENIQFNVQIINHALNQDLTGLSANLYVYGKSVKHKIYQLLDQANSTFDLPRRAEHVLKGRPIFLEYDDNEAAKFGVKYDGYVVVVKDASGQIVSSKAVKPEFLKNLDKLEKLRMGDAFDAKLEPCDYSIIFEPYVKERRISCCP